MTVAPAAARFVDGGRYDQRSSQISTPTANDGIARHSNTVFAPKGTVSPPIVTSPSMPSPDEK